MIIMERKKIKDKSIISFTDYYFLCFKQQFIKIFFKMYFFLPNLKRKLLNPKTK